MSICRPTKANIIWLLFVKVSLYGSKFEYYLKQVQFKLFGFYGKNNIYCHGVIDYLIIDSERKNKAKVIELTKQLGIKQFVISAFYPQANKMIK